jgi:hypothetical protein
MLPVASQQPQFQNLAANWLPCWLATSLCPPAGIMCVATRSFRLPTEAPVWGALLAGGFLVRAGAQLALDQGACVWLHWLVLVLLPGMPVSGCKPQTNNVCWQHS